MANESSATNGLSSNGEKSYACPVIEENEVPTPTAGSTAAAAAAAATTITVPDHQNWISLDSSKPTRRPSSIASSVHGNLMRSHQPTRDPMRVYHVVQLLGEGSMGSVAKVRKRDRVRGANPFWEEQEGEKRMEDARQGSETCCWILPSPFRKVKDNSFVAPPAQLDESVWVSSTSHQQVTTDDGSVSIDEKAPILETKNPKALHRSDSALIKYEPREAYYALKSIHLDRCSTPEYQRELQNEVDILRSLDHPNIVKALETYHYHDRLFIVLEICSGGDLYTRDPYTQDQAAKIMRAVLSAVAYLHRHQVVHRDLKFENIMFCDLSRHATVKIIDFGLSQKFAKDEHLQLAVGTVYTMSPELLAGDYDAKVDVWSCGVIAYMLLSSSLPFYGENRSQVIKRIVAGKFSYSSKRWNDVDTEARVFVRDLLERNPKLRPSAEEACKLAWLDLDDDDLNESARDMDAAFDNIQAHIQAFADYSQLKKLALMVIAYQSTSEEIGYLRKVFRMYDKTNDGAITFDEFKTTLNERYNYSDAELEAMFQGIDIDGTGTVQYCEFLAATMESHGSIGESRLSEAFDRLDSDDEGYITVQDLRNFLGPEVSDNYLDAVINESDLTRDHKVSYEDFLGLWNIETDNKIKSAKDSMLLRRLNSAATSLWSSITSGAESVSSDSSALTSDIDGGSACFQKVKQEVSIRKLSM